MWYILFPPAPGICLLWRRLLYFLRRLRVFTAVCVRSAVVSVTVGPTVVDCTRGTSAEYFNSVLSPFVTKVKSSEVELQFASAEGSLDLDEMVSALDASSVTISSCVFLFWISLISATRSDHGCCGSWEEEEDWSGASVEEVGDGGISGGSSWRLTESKCKTGGAALESSLERRAEITVWNSPSSWCTDESSAWRRRANQRRISI